jgi:hypothetical protein
MIDDDECGAVGGISAVFSSIESYRETLNGAAFPLRILESF